MHITIDHHESSFNINLASSPAKEPFLTIKGCRIVDGSKGRFVSFPSRKMDNGKYWNHCYGSDAFISAVIAEFDKGQKRPAPAKRDENMPF